MSKKQLEQKYGIEIEIKDDLFFVFKRIDIKNKIMLFLAPDLEAIDKSMKYKEKTGF